MECIQIQSISLIDVFLHETSSNRIVIPRPQIILSRYIIILLPCVSDAVIQLLCGIKGYAKGIILIAVPDFSLSISNKYRTELFVPVVVGQFLSSAERFHPCPEMITGALLFSSLLLQKLSIVVYKAGSPAVFQQFKTQAFRVIAVLLHIASFSFHPYLLAAAVIGEPTDSGCIFLLYYTALTVIRKLFSIGRAFLFDQLVLLIIKITDFSLCIRLPDSVSGFVIGIANRSAVPPLFQKLSPDIISIREIQSIAS